MSASRFDILCSVAAAERDAPQQASQPSMTHSNQQMHHQHTLPPLRNLPNPSTSYNNQHQPPLQFQNRLAAPGSSPHSQSQSLLHHPSAPSLPRPTPHHSYHHVSQHQPNSGGYSFSQPNSISPSQQQSSQFRLSSSAPTHGGILAEGALPNMDTWNSRIPPPPQPPQPQPPVPQQPLAIPASNGGYSAPRAILNPAPVLSPLFPSSAPATLTRNLSAPSLTETIGGANPTTGNNNNNNNDTTHYIPGPRARRIPVPTGSRAPLPSMLSGSPGTGIGSPGGTLSPGGNTLSSPVYGSSPPLGVSSLTRGRVGNNNGYNGPGGMKSMSSRSSGKSSGRRDSYTRFTTEEENMLLDGVRLFGVGNWKKILTSYKFHGKRTAVDLKDKYRNMTRAKLRRMNASSQSDLSSVGSDDNGPTRRDTNGAQAMSPLQGGFLSKDNIVGISPVSTANTTPAGSIEERAVAMGAMSISNKGPANGMSR